MSQDLTFPKFSFAPKHKSLGVQGSVSNFSSPLLLLFVGITKSSVFEEKNNPAFFYYNPTETMSQEVAAFKLVLVGDGGTGKVSI